jgi:hypothetical protein
MRHGLRYLQVTLGVCLVMSVGAASAQAYVYWTLSNGNAIGRANLDGTGVDHSLITGTGSPDAIAVDGSYIYWSDSIGGVSSIGRASLDGSGADPTWISDLPYPVTQIATDGTYIYWVDDHFYIARALLNGTDVNTSFIDTGGNSVGSLAIASGTLYFGSAKTIFTVPATGGEAPTSFLALSDGANPPPFVESLATASGYVYWTAVTSTFGAEIGASQLGAGQQHDLVSGAFLPGGVATDGRYLYWVEALGGVSGPGQIGRAQLDGGTAVTGVVHDFIYEPTLPGDVAVDAGIDPTRTTVTCQPPTVVTGQPTACTATVADSASTSPPAGTVSFSASGAFFTGGPCQLAPDAGGGGASCTVGANLTTPGPRSLTASYAGDAVHSPSSGATTVCSGASCAPKPRPKCDVPKLKGKTLAQARTALRKAHCALGKVKKPKHGRHLVVSATKPRAGTKLPSGSKVAVTLAARRRRR